MRSEELAERVGFEPTEASEATSVFGTDAIIRSATVPLRRVAKMLGKLNRVVAQPLQ